MAYNNWSDILMCYRDEIFLIWYPVEIYMVSHWRFYFIWEFVDSLCVFTEAISNIHNAPTVCWYLALGTKYGLQKFYDTHGLVNSTGYIWNWCLHWDYLNQIDIVCDSWISDLLSLFEIWWCYYCRLHCIALLCIDLFIWCSPMVSSTGKTT